MRPARTILLLLSLIVVISVTSCSSELPDALPGGQGRDKLGAKTLFDSEYVPDNPVHNDYFTPRGDSSSALHALNGTLTVGEFVMQDTIPTDQPRSESGRYFPGFSVDFFTYDDYLVPANREILPAEGESSRWRLIMSPGKVWSEAKDDGMSRASFPFVLVTQTSNEAHNGLATFLFDDTRVSDFYFQITQETSAWNRNDYWGQKQLDYFPGSIENESELAAQFSDELAEQVDIKLLSELAPRIDSEILDAFDGGLEPEDISTSGLITEDAIYLQPNVTRYGLSPYSRYSRHGVFSVTKSIGAAVAMLRLAEKYGDEVFDLKIVDYVDITASHEGWQDVTFGNALSMATGVGDMERDPSSGYVTADEDQNKFQEWMDMPSTAEKLEGAFEYGKYDWGPGEVVRYNSITTFVLGAAMDAFLESKEGPNADIWQMVEEEIYTPIGIYQSPIMRTIEPDGSLGLPIFGYGLYPTVDDTAKITRLLQNGGRHDGDQLLSSARLAEALYKTEEQGLSVYRPNQYGESRYLHSFWSVAHCTESDGCFQVPYMLGYGGNMVALLPNEVVAFRYADAYNYDPEPLVSLGMAVR
ncbi:MAG TPA: serine hydrolase [candidate division Zixibacteria bacterium]|nr:serine hydrolase [candidate division Zixibacteria bacterium]